MRIPFRDWASISKWLSNKSNPNMQMVSQSAKLSKVKLLKEKEYMNREMHRVVIFSKF